MNPARSTGPALFVGGWALAQLWLFWVAPIVGAALGGVVYRTALKDSPAPDAHAVACGLLHTADPRPRRFHARRGRHGGLCSPRSAWRVAPLQQVDDAARSAQAPPSRMDRGHRARRRRSAAPEHVLVLFNNLGIGESRRDGEPRSLMTPRLDTLAAEGIVLS